MKIAYLILCHIDPAHICRLAKKLTEGTQNEVFVHVDGKCDVHPFEKTLSGLERVHLLSHRVKVHWGGYSAVEATILLMWTALAAGDFGKYILLQGLEYPIKSNREIDRFLEADPKREYMLHKIYHGFMMCGRNINTDSFTYWITPNVCRCG